ncbi:MAG: hypothetical protein J7480_01545 [Microbacteriaceae bacterium]|nr:hypothetical protein [Microbacteriaceae bacterium]
MTRKRRNMALSAAAAVTLVLGPALPAHADSVSWVDWCLTSYVGSSLLYVSSNFTYAGTSKGGGTCNYLSAAVRLYTNPLNRVESTSLTSISTTNPGLAHGGYHYGGMINLLISTYSSTAS